MYKIVGADQKEYGPDSADQVREWIAEGRANGQTLARFEEGPWKPLSTFPEFASLVGSSAPPRLGTAPPAYGTVPVGVPRKNNKLALAGFVLSIFGLLQCCTPLFAILGLIFSCIGFYQVKQAPDRFTGTGLAMAGIITSVVGLLIFCFLLASGILSELMKSFPHLSR